LEFSLFLVLGFQSFSNASAVYAFGLPAGNSTEKEAEISNLKAALKRRLAMISSADLEGRQTWSPSRRTLCPLEGSSILSSLSPYRPLTLFSDEVIEKLHQEIAELKNISFEPTGDFLTVAEEERSSLK
jgi:hypothetical protein